ncbi:farnesyl-diphosphate synthase [Litorimonas taeanensis]|uniref:Farnesyl-diphosphate synthase n=1 Tax=Litorimonas taeanensis TaxID=568099 RepID=A0A420WIT7_9PROT|nr:farnesyl diphosphate synthase [Litorimonas taeanensis]RKQ70849.1 farnesyl-diphosphate synthase [Litorimonas taeanensis]
MSGFKSQLASVAADVEQGLDKLLPVPQGQHGIVAEAMRYACLGGGKRLRPFLVIETARLFGGDLENALTVGCALECLHVYSLVHDDLPCMDDDDLRRGRPTVHKAYDEAIAVLAGDGLLTHAFALLGSAAAHENPSIRAKLVCELAEKGGVAGMIGGQVIDMTVAETDRDETLITRLQAMKTGALIKFAVRAGAIISGANDSEIMSVSRYARDVGLAFQIQDDILDVEGDAELMGKAVQKDENLGKATFVSLLGLEAARDKAKSLGDCAKDHLAPFGTRAQTLKDTVDFVLQRQH